MKLFRNTFIDKTLIKIILAIYFTAYIVDFMGSLLRKYAGNSEHMDMESIFESITVYLFFFVLKLLFLFLAIFITVYFMDRKSNILANVIFHTFGAIVLSFYSSTVSIIITGYIENKKIELTSESVWLRGLGGLSFNFFVYISIIAIVYAYYYSQKQKQVAVKQEQLKTQLLDSKINALQSQLQPHFLFNTLNDISALMDIDIEKSQDAMANLSELLRNSLNLKNTKYITLNDELSFLNKYLDIEKLRFGNKIKTSLNIDTNSYKSLVPPLMLQPFIENVVKHGFSYNHDILTISLNIFINNNRLIFEISNDGKPIDDANIVFGNGITNVLERFDNLYKGDYLFEIKNKIKEGIEIVNIEISIPLQFQE